LIVALGAYKVATMLAGMTTKTSIGGSAIASWLSLAKGVKSAKDAVALFSLTLKSIPFTAWFTAIATLASYFYLFNNSTDGLKQKLEDIATAFDGVNKYDCVLYVLEGSVEMYKSKGSNWEDFYFILPIGTTEITGPVLDVTIESGDNTATFTWPTNSTAELYKLVITKDGETICTLLFNGEGQLAGISFAPAHNGNQQAPAAIMTAAGMQFTVSGLSYATRYDYSLIVKDGSSNVLADYSGSFGTTNAPQGMDQLTFESAETNKILRNNQIFILRGEKEYTLTGQEVK
jgi:hypothetical protein